MIPANLQPLANHLWQSTLFALPVALLAVALRKNRAAVRYWLWLAASVKFLIPFSLLVDAGRRFEWGSHPAISQPQFSYAVDQIVRPFVMLAPAPPQSAAASAPVEFSTILLGVWLCGAAIGAVCWFRSWRRIHAAKRSASPLYLKLPIPAFSTPSQMEPGVFGIRKPVLLLPEGILDRLTPAQLEAVFAHELCHVWRQDNLTAAIHTVVETIFWFHPLVWWIRARLVEEREHACDEEVLGKVGDAQDYAEGILNVCKLYLESPLKCVSGVMGSNLKKRVHSIIYARTPLELNFRTKFLLGVAGFAVVAGPIAIGIANAPPSLAQSTAGAQAAPASKAMQAEAVGPLEFDAASLKVTADQRFLETRPRRSVGRIRWNTYLLNMLSYAYQMEWWRISDAPGRTTIYTLEATTPPNTTQDQVRLMLRNLLIERFQLEVHRETRVVSDGYSLEVGKGGPKLQTTKALPETGTAEFDDGYVINHLPEADTMVLKGHSASMLQLAELLQRSLGTSVVNRTDLTERYDFELLCPWDATQEASPSLLASCVKKLGLAMQKYKGPVEFLVIDHLGKLEEN